MNHERQKSEGVKWGMEEIPYSLREKLLVAARNMPDAGN